MKQTLLHVEFMCAVGTCASRCDDGGADYNESVVRSGSHSDPNRAEMRFQRCCQKRQTFFFRSFLFQRDRLSNSSMDIPKTLKNSSSER